MSNGDAGEDWRASIDLDRLADWMDARSLEHGAIVDVVSLAGGTQNILVGGRAGSWR